MAELTGSPLIPMDSYRAPEEGASLAAEVSAENRRQWAREEMSTGQKLSQFGQLMTDAAGNDWAVFNLDRAFDRNFETDPDFTLPDPESSEGKELWDGISLEDTERFVSARSLAEFQWMKARYLEEQDLDRRTAEAGAVGIIGRMGVNALAPEQIAFALATGPTSMFMKGSRLARMGKLGLVNAAAGAATEEAVRSGSVTRDTTDTLVAAAFGFTLGGLAGGLYTPRELDDISRAVDRTVRDAVRDEVNDARAAAGHRPVTEAEVADAERAVQVREREAADAASQPRDLELEEAINRVAGSGDLRGAGEWSVYDQTPVTWDAGADAVFKAIGLPGAPRTRGQIVVAMDRLESGNWSATGKEFAERIRLAEALSDKLRELHGGKELRFRTVSVAQSVASIKRIFSNHDQATIEAAVEWIRRISPDGRAPDLRSTRTAGDAYFSLGRYGNKPENHVGLPKAPNGRPSVFESHMGVPDMTVLFHEVGHWAYRNVLTAADRMEFMKRAHKIAYDGDGKFNRKRLMEHLFPNVDPSRGKLGITNGATTPQELFAHQFSIWMTREGKADGLLGEVTLWKRITDLVKQVMDIVLNRAKVDPVNAAIFRKIYPGTGDASVPQPSRWVDVDTSWTDDLAEVPDEALKAHYGSDFLGSVSSASRPDTSNAKIAKAMEELPDVPQSAFGNSKDRVTARWDIASVLRGSDNPLVRKLFGRLVGEPVGSKGHAITPIGATEEKARLERIYKFRLRNEADNAYKEFLKDTGGAFIDRFNPRKRDEFMRQVGRAQMGMDGNYHPAATALASKMQSMLAEIGEEAVRLGVLDELLQDFRMPRMWNHDALNDAVVQHTWGKMATLFQGAVRESPLGRMILAGADPERADAAIKKLGEGFLKRLRQVGREIDMPQMFGVRAADAEYVRELLTDVGADSDTIEYVMGELRRMLEKRDAPDAGKHRHARHRMQLDPNFGMHIDGKLVRIGDFIEQNSELVQTRYLDAMTGRIAAARTTGILTDAELQRRISIMKEAVDDPAERKRIEDYANLVWNYLTGRPLESDPDGFWAKFGRNMRAYNMARMGASFGIAQIADLGNLVAVGGVRALLEGVPAFREITRRGADGRFLNELSQELSEVAALGIDALSQSVFWSEMGDHLLGRAGALEYAGRVSSHAAAVAGGMTKINQWSQFLVGRMVVNRLANKQMTAERLAYAGLSESDAKAIAEQLAKHGVRDTAGNVSKMNVHKWPDQELAARFIAAVRKVSTRAVQENDFGATHPFMHTTLGKLIAQFRSFTIVAWSKQTLHSVHMKDSEAFLTFAWGAMFGTLSYVASVYANSPASTWEERLAPNRLVAAALSRSGATSALPMLVDSPLGFLGFDPLFDTRASGLPSTGLAQIPAVEAVDRLQRGVSGVIQAALDPEREFTQKDLNNFRRMFPLQNALAVGPGLHAAADLAGIPRE